MILTKVEVTNVQGNTLSLPLDDISSGFVVENIDGLDPVTATLVSSSYASIDGSQYQSSRREARNIRLSIGLVPDYVNTSVRDLRAQLYAYFMPKSLVTLLFYMGEELTVYIMARVESMETALFTSDPVVDISLLCFDPDFLELEPTEFVGESTEESTEETIDYTGTTETGFTFELLVDRTVTQFTLYNRRPDDTLESLDVEADLEAGDVVTVCTIVGQKGVTLLRSGITSSLLYGVTPQSTWLEFWPGENDFRAYIIGAPIAYNLTYSVRHGGL